mmetsp:Transcript_79970/g.212261  ORF Transcript_79970/g.212261 Transcript_79970/m.212261 type:complete len:380 (-) Transcript_79970:1113-2252(-)
MSPSHQRSRPSPSSSAEKVSVTPSADISQENDRSVWKTSSTRGPSAHCIEPPSMVPIHSPPSSPTHLPSQSPGCGPAGSADGAEVFRGSSQASQTVPDLTLWKSHSVQTQPSLAQASPPSAAAGSSFGGGGGAEGADTDGMGGPSLLLYGVRYLSLKSFMPAPLKSRTCQPLSLWATRMPVTPFSTVLFWRLCSWTRTPSSRAPGAASDVSTGSGAGAAGVGSVRTVCSTFEGTCAGFSLVALMMFSENIRAISFFSTPPFCAASLAAFISCLSPDAAAAAKRSRSPWCFDCVFCLVSSSSFKRRCANKVSSLKPCFAPSSTQSRSSRSLSLTLSMRWRNSFLFASNLTSSAFNSARICSACCVWTLSIPAARARERAS